MTPEQQRVKIAEACGWILEVYQKDGKPTWRGRLKTEPYGTINEVPDYPADLNAMHEAEKVIVNAVGSDIRSRWFIHMQAFTDVAGIHATAAQRAEAFLLTLNLWTD